MATTNKRSMRIRLNILALRFSRNWLRIVTGFLAIYVALPIIAPALMNFGLEGVGRNIYTLYSPFCHQFGFRSFYLFGDQPVYPRESTGSGWDSYESYVEGIEDFVEFTAEDEFTLEWSLAHKFYYGNDTMGYKTGLCERDMFIYGALLMGAILYNVPKIRRRLRPVPLWLYALLGLSPIAIDGFSQLLGYPPFEFWAPRETLPEFRVITGFLFGIMTAWLGLPYINSSMQETEVEIGQKLQQANIDI